MRTIAKDASRHLILLLFFFSLHITTTRAQQTQETISLDMKGGSLGDFIQKIEGASGYTFIYGEEVRLSRQITIRAKHKPIDQILRETFANSPIRYTIKGNHIVLQLEKEKPESVKKHTISGYVFDAMSKESLIGANLFIPEAQIGTATNPYGFFSLTLPEGKVSIQISYIGYVKTIKEIDLKKDVSLQIGLSAAIGLKEVVIYGEKAETGFHASQMGALDIPLQQIKNTPALPSVPA